MINLFKKMIMDIIVGILLFLMFSNLYHTLFATYTPMVVIDGVSYTIMNDELVPIEIDLC